MIVLREVCKSYDGGRTQAVDHVDLDVPEGGFLAIVGESGSGKSTLVKTINRLIEPDSGRVEIGGHSARDEPAPQLRRRIGYVFQGVGLFPHLSVAENIGITPRLLGWPQPEIAKRVDEMLELARLPRAYASRAPEALSGGQRQRVGIARALAAKPAIVLLDEAFGALDPITRASLGDEYRRLHDQLGLTTVMITHDVGEAVLLADRIAVMKTGRLLATGTAEELVRHAEPYVRELMETPRQQARRLAARLNGGHGDQPEARA